MEGNFYLPENKSYTIVDSMRDSIRFTVDRTLTEYGGHLCSKSSFVDPEGQVMGWHDFGNLEGPGWAANAVGGAYEIYRYGRFTRDGALQDVALSVLDHVLEDGFVDEETGFIYGYRDTVEDRICLNYKHNDDWFCPGAMAKIAYQLLIFSDLVPDIARHDKMIHAAIGCAQWIRQHVKPCTNGWFPRRVARTGQHCAERPEGVPDPLFATSADGLFIVQLMTELTRRGLADYRAVVAEKASLFAQLGGLFGSVNHDTYDHHENVAYAVGFRVLRAAADVTGNDQLESFAYNACLKGLDQFKMPHDRHGVKCKGLLFMEKTWDTAYLWESAEAALAYIEAYGETSDEQYLSDGLTILRAIAGHHHGGHGFLTEGVDWNNHVGSENHFDGAEFGDIQYTEPFLNNQHIAEPTLVYLENYAERHTSLGNTEYRDFEGNRLCTLA